MEEKKQEDGTEHYENHRPAALQWGILTGKGSNQQKGERGVRLENRKQGVAQVEAGEDNK